ncbi:RNA-binding protein [Hathewaya proteolytica DSM 3090]|uniref:RNA-binding protein n=1 Tax=Hathewaya proteolytica DSM 3090 TaxID=1121331 RepID=A0A1M6JJ90_9CLOT|nr:ribosome assembly RNA-binding protein YhbY [Hathewaya proteolytica]SHJ46685.1 RNA-binding protein [Hathewaya proteolytica DSM 3090]
MITSKQRATLRALANTMEPIFQVGKLGIEENFICQIDSALEARELIKVKVLENSGLTAREASEILCDELKCEGVQIIGNKIVIYRKSQKKPKIEI